jgi:hypothetical protein
MQNFVVARTSLLDASAATELAATPPPGTTAAAGVRARSVSRLFRLSSVSTALAFRMLRARRAAVAASTSSEASAHMASAKSSMIAVPKYPCVFRSPAVAAAASFSQMVVAPARRAATSSLNSEATCTQPTIPCKLHVASPTTTPASSTQSGAPSRTTRSPALSSDSSNSSDKSAVSAEVIETTDREVEEAAGTRKAVTSHTHNASRPHSIVLCRRRARARARRAGP